MGFNLKLAQYEFKKLHIALYTSLFNEENILVIVLVTHHEL